MRNTLLVLSLVAVGSFIGSLRSCGSSMDANVNRQFHKNGRIAIEQRYDESGRLHGIWKEWDETGALREQYECSHGAVIATKRFAPDGRVLRETREGADYRLVPVKNGNQ